MRAQHTQAPTQLPVTHTGPRTCICSGTCHTWKHPNPVMHTCTHTSMRPRAAQQQASLKLSDQERDAGEELSPWMPRPVLGSLHRATNNADGSFSFFPLSHPAQAPARMLRGPFGSVVPDLSSQLSALFVTSLKRGFRLINHLGFGSSKGRMGKRSSRGQGHLQAEGAQPRSHHRLPGPFLH